MKRVFIGTLIAAACAVGLSAQQPPASTTAQSGRQGRMGGPMTLTGCVKAGDTSGTYMLTNVQRSDTGMGSGAATTTAGAATSTAAGAGQGMGRGMGQIMLNASGDVDLSAHVGHKVEVTGTMSGGRRMGGGGAATTTGGGGATTTAGSAGSTAAGGATTSGQGGGRGMRSMSVTSLKMISTDCGS